MKDKILDEIHRYRAEHARRFKFDLRTMGEDLQKRQEQSGRRIFGLMAKRKRL